MLFGYPVINRASFRLNEYFEAGVFDRDRVSQTNVELIYAGGDPAKGGPNHLALCSEELRAYLTAESQWYQREILGRGLGQFYRLQQMDEMCRLLKLSKDDIPGIAFLPRHGDRVAGMLRIPRRWYADETALNAFDSVLREWLASEELQRLAAAESDWRQLSPQLKPMLADLAVNIDAAVENRVSRTLPVREMIDPSTTTLVIDRRRGRCFYRAEEFCLTPTPFRLLVHLAASPGVPIPVEEAAIAVLGDREDSIVSTPRWIRDHKLEIMNSLRKLVGRSGISREEVDGLIRRRSSRILLNLGGDDVLLT